MAHIHTVKDTDIHYKIDGVSRVVTNVNETKRMLVQNDHNSERLTFEVPRYIEGHDLTTCNVVQVHYLNTDTYEEHSSPGVYEVDDLGIKGESDEDKNTVILTWLVSGNATRYIGTLNFIIRFSCVTNGVVEYAWNTTLFKGIMVLEGLNNAEQVVGENYDILEQWKQELIKAGVDALTLDRTLMVEGEAADARVTGDAIRNIMKKLDDMGDGTEWGAPANGEIFELSTEKEPAKPVACLGITLSKSSITFDNIESTETLSVTVAPFDTTDEVFWSIDNESVATLNNGVVTPIANGTATVTVTCGDYSATCVITVKIIPSYAKSNLMAYYDLTQYGDGYTGEVEDLSGNEIIPVITGQTSYITGRNGFIGGKFMINKHKETGKESTIKIPSNDFFKSYPFSVEVYAHLRGDYNIYAPNGELNFSTALGSVDTLSAAAVVSTQGGGTSGNGVQFLVFKNEVNIKGNVNTPYAIATLDEELTIDRTALGTGAASIITDVYYHLVACFDANSQKVYVNGIKVLDDTKKSVSISGDRDMKFFASSLRADLKLVRVYKSILTDEQVANNYSHTIGTMG